MKGKKLREVVWVFVWSGKCQFGEMSVGCMAVGNKSVWNLSGLGKVSRVFVWSGNCPSGKFPVGEVPVGEVSVGDVSGYHISRNSMRHWYLY